MSARRVGVAVLASAGLACAAACSSSSVPQPGKSTTPAVQISSAVLKSALITKADLPSGYTVDTTGTSSPTSITATDNATCNTEIAQLNAVTHAPATATANFAAGEAQVMVEQLGSFATQAQASKVLSDIRSALANCHQFQVPSSIGEGVPLTMTTLSLPHLADDSLALEGKGTNDGLNIVLDVDLARNGNTLVVIAEGGLAADQKVVAAATRSAVLKLRAVLDPAAASSTPAG